MLNSQTYKKIQKNEQYEATMNRMKIDKTNENNIFCYCGGDSFGEMVLC